MRIDRYTQKMQEGLQAAQDLASQLNNSEITNEHFFPLFWTKAME